MSKDSSDKASDGSLAGQFLFARFKHNQDFMNHSPVIQALLAKKDEWTQEDLEDFRNELAKLNLDGDKNK